MAHVIRQPAPGPAVRTGLFSQLLPSRHQLLRSEAVWLALILFVVIAKMLSDTVIPVTFRSPGQQNLFMWENMVTTALLGLVCIWCARAIGFPDAWAARIISIQRLVLPTAVGLGIGALAIGIDVLTADTQGIWTRDGSAIVQHRGFPRGISGRELTERAYNQAWLLGATFILWTAPPVSRYARRSASYSSPMAASYAAVR